MKFNKLEAKVNMVRKLKDKVVAQEELTEETNFFNKFMSKEYLIDDGSEQSCNEERNL